MLTDGATFALNRMLRVLFTSSACASVFASGDSVICLGPRITFGTASRLGGKGAARSYPQPCFRDFSVSFAVWWIQCPTPDTRVRGASLHSFLLATTSESASLSSLVSCEVVQLLESGRKERLRV
jgi:hypothetical protein